MPKGVYERKPLTKEHKRKLSEWMKKHPNKGQFIKGTSLWLGRHHSKESIEKIRLSKLNNPNGFKKDNQFGKLNKGKHFNIGKNNPNWIEDRTKLKINKLGHRTTQYIYWSKSVKKRDNYKCKINNCDCQGKVVAHHILPWRDYPELRYNINNGITLCQFHHPRKWSEEKRLIPYFKGLVEVIIK